MGGIGEGVWECRSARGCGGHDEERLAAWAEVGSGGIGRREESVSTCYHLSCMCTGPHRLPLDRCHMTQLQEWGWINHLAFLLDQHHLSCSCCAQGRTGFPWIDAIMTQLREWGWIHHLTCHSLAFSCYCVLAVHRDAPVSPGSMPS